MASARSQEDMLKKLLQAAMLVGGLCATSPVVAADFEVQMLNQGPGGQIMHFEPAFLSIMPGDTVTFVPTDKGHNSESIGDMAPSGAQTWKGKTNEKITVTFTVPGLYGFKCQPHFAMGMVGLIEVGHDLENMNDLVAVKLPPRAQARMFELFAKTIRGDVK